MRIKPISGFPGYYVTIDGRVLTSRRHKNQFGEDEKWIRKWLKQRKQNSGYLVVYLYKNGKSYTRTVHRLVAEAFLRKKEGCNEINHKDGNKENNRVENLEWTTRSENAKHMHKKGIWKLSEKGLEQLRKNGKKKPSEEAKKKMALKKVSISFETAKAIREEYLKNKTGQNKLAEMFGTNPGTAYRASRNLLKAYDLDS